MWCFKFLLMWSIGLHIQRNKCGQTSRPVVGVEIQTLCDITASPCSCNNFLLVGVSCGSISFWNIGIGFTVAFAFMTFSLIISVFSYTKIYLKLRHHQLQVHAHQGQPNGGRIPLNIARYIQEVSFQRIIGAVGFSYLLCPVYCRSYANDIWPGVWKQL